MKSGGFWSAVATKLSRVPSVNFGKIQKDLSTLRYSQMHLFKNDYFLWALQPEIVGFEVINLQSTELWAQSGFWVLFLLVVVYDLLNCIATVQLWSILHHFY